MVGVECRALFSSKPGWLLVGCDQQGLELRCLAHFLFPHDAGAYKAIMLLGDPHAANQKASGVETRAIAKRLISALIYGGGDYKLGTIIVPDEPDPYYVAGVGKYFKNELISNIPGFRQLFRWVDSFHGNALPGLDGRELFARKKHTRLNTLLQGAGALLCKKWILLSETELQRRGLRHGLGDDDDYCLHIWCHDELQIGARTPEIAAIIAEVTEAQAAKAGEFYGLLCPTAGKATIGYNWSEIH